jgi:aminoglycoside 6-adenylyltransferase
MEDPRFDELLDRVAAWGEESGDVRGIILFGSRARRSRPGDRWSDVDLLVSCREPAALLGSTEWLERLGEVRISFLETNPIDGGKERRVLFASGLDVDLSFVQARQLRQLRFALGPAGFLVPPSKRREARTGTWALATILRPGYRIVLDKDDLLEPLIELVLSRPSPPPPERSLEEIWSDFWYHAVWVAKKLRRGELWMAKGCCDCYLKDLVAQALFLGRERPLGLIPARLVDETLDPDSAQLLRESFARYDATDLARALTRTLDLFHRVARQAAERIGASLDDSEEEFVRSEVARVLADR